MSKMVGAVALSALCFFSGACTTLRGAPDQLISPGDAKLLVQGYSISAALQELKKPAVNKSSYRNEFVYAYIVGYDSLYSDFKNNLSEEKRSTELGFDGALIGVSAASTLIEQAASDLSALTQALVSTRASVDKNFYAERTLPALIAAMDADRLRIRTLIETKLTRTIDEYPFSEALADLQAYQDAGSLNSAIATITDEAVEQRISAKQDFVRVRYKCEPIVALQPRLAKIRNFVGGMLQKVTADGASASEKADAEKNFRDMATSAFAVEGAQSKQLEEVVRDMARPLVGDGKDVNFCSEGEVSALENSLKQYGFVA